MSDHRATIEWRSTAAAAEFTKGRYSREHTWSFDGGVAIMASPAPSNVPAPWSNPAHVDPEEAFVASVSSCHMLTFLYLAAKAGFVVESYRDAAVGILTKGPTSPWISKITLAPIIVFAGDHQPDATRVAELHHAAHDGCYIASSIKTEVVIATTS